ncbi:MAG TPA: hypothetical protein DDZ51_16115 [Planctomycetaceae bacterium]|nr:hypothetical protein [Planctomycetaceae bacterium]
MLAKRIGETLEQASQNRVNLTQFAAASRRLSGRDARTKRDFWVGNVNFCDWPGNHVDFHAAGLVSAVNPYMEKVLP